MGARLPYLDWRLRLRVCVLGGKAIPDVGVVDCSCWSCVVHVHTGSK